MAGLNHIREAYEQMYAQLDERMDPEERALRRAEVADKKASRMDSKVASKYASSEAQSAARADKKSRGKHIHGMTDSYDVDGDLVDEGKVELKQRNKNEMQRRAGNAARTALSSRGAKKTAAMDRMSKLVKAIGRDDEEKRWKKMGEDPRHNPNYKSEEYVMERELDPTEKGEKERLVKGLKKSAADFKARYGKRAKSVMYATATKMAKDRMDTSKSDRRYSVER